MIMDPRLLQGVSLRMERVLAGRGWDSDAMLVSLHRAVMPDGGDGVSVQSFPFFDETYREGGIGPALDVLSTVLADPERSRKVAELVGGPTLVGLALACESYYATFAPGTELPPNMGDVPQAAETRNVFIIDCAGVVYLTHRTRGSDVESVVVHPNSAYKVGGLVLTWLRDLLLPIASYLPDEEADIVAISQCVTLIDNQRHLVIQCPGDDEPL